MTRDRWVQFAAIITAVLCVVGSTLLVAPINQQRVDLQIVQQSRFGDAPKYALLAASLGTFRGLAADFLWYRAEKLKSEGKLFEANTTAGWITTLQPRFGQVWVFQSWNMAYNISVLTHTPEERWDWVNKGIKILRDEGIVYNPSNIAIYRQLGWTFFHKIGQRSDDMNHYYKIKLAEEWQELLGNPTEGATKELALERFGPIADAADLYFGQTVETTDVRDPLTYMYEVDPPTRALVARLREIGYEPGQVCMRAIGRIMMFQRYADPRQLAGPDGPFLDERASQLYPMLNDPQYADAFLPLIQFMQAKVLIEDYHMDPRRMYKLMEKFGPMDWRHAASHACYWGATGVEMAGEMKEKTKIDVLNTDRQVIHAMQMLMNSGAISYNPMSRRYDTTPDPRFIDSYGDAMVEANERQVSIEWAGSGNTTSFEQGHENFLKRAVLYAFLYGDIDKAQGYYKQLRDLYGQKPHNYDSGGYTQDIQDMIITELQADWQMTDQVARPLIESLMFRSFRQGLAKARYDKFQRFLETAQRVEQKLIDKMKYDNATAPTGQGRLISWESFGQLLGSTYIKYMHSPQFDLLERAAVYRNSPLPLVRSTYPLFRETIAEHAVTAGYGQVFDQLFPPPPDSAADQTPGQGKPGDEAPTGQESIERK
jgi:hypothetical protein